MNRYAIELSYNGTLFFGWQRQPNQISVQEEIENALTKLNHLHPVTVVGCGRTDSGVHAQHYVLHADLPSSLVHGGFVFKLNQILPDSISIHSIQKVADDFHARFSAKTRTYRYFINQKKNPFNTAFSLYHPNQLNIEKMNLAAEQLFGKQDFTSFSKVHTDVKTNICTVHHAQWVETSPGELFFEITADRFLRNMVRATVGTLLEIGTGKIEIENIRSILDQKNRSAAKASVPGHALFLWKITY